MAAQVRKRWDLQIPISVDAGVQMISGGDQDSGFSWSCVGALGPARSRGRSGIKVLDLRGMESRFQTKRLVPLEEVIRMPFLVIQ
jgi:hypothetical protein